MKIALFVTCLADAMFPDVGRATVAVLERLGHQVLFPAGQTCCGQMHVNTGYQRQAVKLVRRHVEWIWEARPLYVRPRRLPLSAAGHHCVLLNLPCRHDYRATCIQVPDD